MQVQHDDSDFLPLTRGSACLTCRRRKVKCDGEKPVCRQCNRRASDCVYSDAPGPSVERMLEEQISRLEARIQEVENVRSPVVLQPGPVAQPPAGWWELPEPPADIVQYIVQQFLPHSRRVGFFLDASFDPTSNTKYQVPAVLRFAIYLWGIRLSGNAEYARHEPAFLARTLRLVQKELMSAQTQNRLMFGVLQAEVLIAYYFFASARVTEGQVHISAAVALAYACGMHQLPPGVNGPPSVDGALGYNDYVNAWWHIFFLERCWSSFLELPCAVAEHGPDRTIDTAWPQVTENTTTLGSSSGRTIQRFLEDVTSDSHIAPLALRSKAAALLGRSSELAACKSDSPWYAQLHAMMAHHDHAIDTFKQMLPSVARPSVSMDIAHGIFVIQSITQAATIVLHKRFMMTDSNSMAKCLSASYRIVRQMVEVQVQRMNHVEPMLAMVCVTACEVMAPLLHLLRSSPYVPSAHTSLPKREELEQALKQLIGSMKHCARTVPLFASQLEKMQGTLPM